MASKELIEKVAEIAEKYGDFAYGHDAEECATEIISTILAAPQAPTRQMLDELKINDAFTYQALATRWNAALKASPLGEQSE